MLTIGLTGGIGAGKSAVATELVACGAVLVDADIVSREVVEPGTPGLAAVVEAFGPSVLDENGALNRPALGKIVFGDEAARVRLGEIMHPVVRERSWELTYAAGPDAIVVQDVPLLTENKLAPTFHLSIVVEAPEEIRLRRLVEVRGMAADDARARIRAQTSDAQRRAVTDIVVPNDTDLADLKQRIADLWSGRLRPYADNITKGRAADQPTEAVAYNPAWAHDYSLAEARLREQFADVVVDVRHVGPTSESGHSAPDVVHVDLTVNANRPISTLREQLNAAGWISRDADADSITEWQMDSADPGRPASLHVRTST